MGRGEDLFGTSYEKGDVVFCQGDAGDAMYLIQSGAVEISRKRGREDLVLAVLESGDFFGEMVLLDDRPRSTTVRVVAPTRLLPLTRDSLRQRLRDDPSVALHLLRAFCRRIEKTNPLGRFADPGEKAGGPSGESGPPVPSGDVDVLARPEDRVTFRPGEAVFRQGEAGDAMYIIAEGKVDLFVELEGDRFLLASFGPGDFFGEMALLSERPRTATAEAATEVRLTVLEKDDFHRRIEENPDLGVYLLKTLAGRLRRLLGDGSRRRAPAAQGGIHSFALKKEGPLKVALVSLSSCAGCSSVILEDEGSLNSILENASIEYCPFLMDGEEMGEVDVAVVEGVVRMKEDEQTLQKARERSRVLLAWGTCATHGGIPALANMFDLEALLEESYGEAGDRFSYYLSGTRFHGSRLLREQGGGLLRSAGKLDDFVRVDCYISGCPPSTRHLAGAIKSFGNDNQQEIPAPLVCSECPRKPRKEGSETLGIFPGADDRPDVCFPSQGVFCMGLVVRGGCGAPCTRGGLPCWGCRGPADVALKNMESGFTFEQVTVKSVARRARLDMEKVGKTVRAVRQVANSALGFYREFTYDRTKLR
jgi:F420-non-reducing hydrogenase small subunit